jgi:hypothetical protein
MGHPTNRGLVGVRTHLGAKTRRTVQSLLRARIRAREWLPEAVAGPPRPTDIYGKSTFLWLRRRARSNGEPWRPQYAWPVISAARTASALGVERISVLEFGVAGGNGLRALEAAAQNVQSLLGVEIEVFGFDTGAGLPAPTDRRDAPFALGGGEFSMDEAKLRAVLRRAELVLGPVGDTIRTFLARGPSPIGFAAFDLDYYPSTIHALSVLEADPAHLLPQVFCYFDDLFWYPWTQFNGERAAIADFNAGHEHRKDLAALWPEVLIARIRVQAALARSDPHRRGVRPSALPRTRGSPDAGPQPPPLTHGPARSDHPAPPPRRSGRATRRKVRAHSRAERSRSASERSPCSSARRLHTAACAHARVAHTPA